LEEINQLLADREEYKSIANISGASKSSIGRHAQEEETKTIIAVLRTGATPDEASSLTAWTENLRMAREKGDSASATRAQKEIDKIRAGIGERKESSKPRKGPSNVAPHKQEWRLCLQCMWKEQLGYYELPSCSSEAYARKLTAEAMAWVTAESNAMEPRWDIVGAFAYGAVALRISAPWPEEYQAVVAKFRAALVDFAAVKEFATAVRRIVGFGADGCPEIRGLDVNNDSKANTVPSP
jgi:hypothetical protein